MSRTRYSRLAFFTALLALAVIMLGAYVRLSDAGLGCPDWPGCYGQLGVPDEQHEIDHANTHYPERPVETAKAWKEMAHRYLAGTLGLLILTLAILAWRGRKTHRLPVVLPSALVGLVLFQALLGMWTVTLLVKPAIVTSHLLGGMATLALLWWLGLRVGEIGRGGSPVLAGLRGWTVFGLLLVIGQITLGGWTSTNYAAVACTEFPTCYGGQWWPDTDFAEAFVIWRGLGVNYEFGVLDSDARTAIHLTHRLGALIVLVYLVWLGITVLRRAANGLPRLAGIALLAALGVQIGLGIANVVANLPLPVAVAHNGGAAILLLCLLFLLHMTKPVNNTMRGEMER